MQMNPLVLTVLLALYNAAWLLGKACNKAKVLSLCNIAASTASWSLALSFGVASLVYTYGLVATFGLAMVALPLLVMSVISTWLLVQTRNTSVAHQLARANVSVLASTTWLALVLATVVGSFDLARS